jgi:hypothetical protein
LKSEQDVLGKVGHPWFFNIHYKNSVFLRNDCYIIIFSTFKENKLWNMANLWHYTTKSRLDEIINSGALKVSIANQTNAKEKATLWFSKNPNWEPTATKLAMTESGVKRLTKKEQFDLFGLGRIQIDENVKLYNWKQFKEFGNANLKLLRKFEEAGIKMGGSPFHWFWTDADVKKDNWLIVEYYDGENWVPYIKEY